MRADSNRRHSKSSLVATVPLARVDSEIREWPLLLILAGIQFTHVLDFVLIMPLGPQLMRLMEISPAEFAVLVSNYNLAAAVAGLIGAFVLDRFDRKHALLVVYLGFLFGTLACGLAPGYNALLAARLIAGAFGGLLQALIFAIIGDSFSEERRGGATGTVMSAFSVASILGVPFGLFLADRFNWRVPFLSLTLISVLILIAGVIVLPSLQSHFRSRQNADSDQPGSSAASFKETLALLYERNTLMAFLLIVSLMFAGFTVIPFMSAYLVSNVGLAERDLASVFLAGGLATLISSRLVGRLADRWGKARVFTWLACLSTLPVLALTHLTHVSIAMAIAVATSFTVMISARGIPALALITSSVGRQRRGSFLSFTSAVQQAASGLASLSAGAMLGHGPRGELTHYGWVGFFAVGATLMSVWAAHHLRPPAET